MTGREIAQGIIASATEADQVAVDRELHRFEEAVRAEHAAEVRATVLNEAAAVLDTLHGDNEHLARDWNWWDAAEIPGSCAALLRRMAADPTAPTESKDQP